MMAQYESAIDGGGSFFFFCYIKFPSPYNVFASNFFGTLTVNDLGIMDMKTKCSNTNAFLSFVIIFTKISKLHLYTQRQYFS